MIETKQAVDNLGAILDVPGIDAIYVGPSDLCFSLGMEPRGDREEPEILRIYDRMIAECARRKIYAGIHCQTPAYAAKAIGMGFRFTTIMNDSGLLFTAARNAVQALREQAKERF
jgi:4-hydroxy-2-oxoheptanedioate aldolase